MNSQLPSCFQITRGYRSSLDLAEILKGTWEQPTIRIFGRETKIPRLTRWFGEATYSYSGVVNAPTPMPTWLDALRREVERDTGARFNSALLNYYRDGGDSVSWHADDEPELGCRPVIASLSIGASRTFAVKTRSGSESWRLPLQDGDLLVMRDASQVGYLHSVPKTKTVSAPRVNVTFRWIS